MTDSRKLHRSVVTACGQPRYDDARPTNRPPPNLPFGAKMVAILLTFLLSFYLGTCAQAAMLTYGLL